MPTLIWEVAHQKIMCNIERQKQNLVISDICTICSSSPETVLHILSDSGSVKSIWVLQADMVVLNFFHFNSAAD